MATYENSTDSVLRNLYNRWQAHHDRVAVVRRCRTRLQPHLDQLRQMGPEEGSRAESIERELDDVEEQEQADVATIAGHVAYSPARSAAGIAIKLRVICELGERDPRLEASVEHLPLEAQLLVSALDDAQVLGGRE
jgi:hypothetical protein